MSANYEFQPKSEYFAIKEQLETEQGSCLQCPQAQRETIIAAVRVYACGLAIEQAKHELTPRVKAGCRLEKPIKYTVNPEDAPVCDVQRSDYA